MKSKEWERRNEAKGALPVSELAYRKFMARLRGTPPQGLVAERLAEAGKIRIRNERLKEDDILCQVLDLIIEGSVDIVLESRT